MADLEKYYEERQKHFPFKPPSHNSLSTSTLPRKGHSKGQSRSASRGGDAQQPRRPAQRPVKPTPPSSGVRENLGYLRSTKASNGKTANKRRVLMPKAMNASMEIWEIQRELKRGEMVQGVLKIGAPTRQEEACICAPVMIGRADGHMNWRSM